MMERWTEQRKRLEKKPPPSVPQQVCTGLLKHVASTSLAWPQYMHICTFLHPGSPRNMQQIHFMIALCGCKTQARLSSDKCMRSTARTLQTVETFVSDVANGIGTQTNLRASICLVFGLASHSFECFPLSRSEWELTMEIAISLLLSPPSLWTSASH